MTSMLQTPKGVTTVATITELRNDTTEVIDETEESGQGVMIVKNSSPRAVLVSFDRYSELVSGSN